MTDIDIHKAKVPQASADSQEPILQTSGLGHLGHLLRRAQQIHTRLWNSDVSSEITSPQVQILSVLDSNPDVDQRTATQLAKLDRSTGAELIERLSRYGYIERRRDADDLRRYLLRLTDSGRALLYEIRPLSRQMHERMLEMVPSEVRAAFHLGLQRFVDAGETLGNSGGVNDPDTDGSGDLI